MSGPEGAPAPRRLALFDLDGTLTPLDSEEQWALWLGERGLLDPEPFYEFHRAYQAGTLNLADYYAWYLDVFRRIEPGELARHRDELVAERMLPSVEARARAWIAEARESHDAVLLVTASNSFLTDSIGATLGFDATLATQLEQLDGRFTGRISGAPCLGKGKLVHVDAWLAPFGARLDALEASCFYSDSHNDLPLLRAVDRAIAVRPDPKLRAVAVAEGWAIHD